MSNNILELFKLTNGMRNRLHFGFSNNIAHNDNASSDT